MDDKDYPSFAELVNGLFRLYRNAEGREYTHKEVEEGITALTGRKILDASYLSRLRNGKLPKPGAAMIEALCYFFPVKLDYFYPRLTVFRARQVTSSPVDQIQEALRSTSLSSSVQDHLTGLVRALTEDDQQDTNKK